MPVNTSTLSARVEAPDGRALVSCDLKARGRDIRSSAGL